MIKGLVSILIPVFNVQDFLPDCLKSIEKQTYENIEVIFVNDGSTDNSKEILKDFCSRHNNAKIIDQTNKGVSSARNTLLANINGEFFYFLDADDVLNINVIKHFVEIQKSNDADVVTANFSNINDNEVFSEKMVSDFQNDYKTILGADICCATYLSRYKSNFSRMLWNKLFKTSILLKIESYPNVFDINITLGEDMNFMCQYLPLCDKINCVNASTYFYRKREGSIVQTKFNRTIFQLLECCSPLDKLDKKIFPKTTANYHSFVCRMGKMMIEKMQSNKCYISNDIELAYSSYKNNLKYTRKAYNNWRVWFTPMSRLRIYLIYKHLLKKSKDGA